MEENSKVKNIGEVCIADEVVAVIAGLAACEVEGVDSMAGKLGNELASRLVLKNAPRGTKVEVGGRRQHRIRNRARPGRALFVPL